jgi:hypothetical protein
MHGGVAAQQARMARKAEPAVVGTVLRVAKSSCTSWSGLVSDAGQEFGAERLLRHRSETAQRFISLQIEGPKHLGPPSTWLQANIR